MTAHGYLAGLLASATPVLDGALCAYPEVSGLPREAFDADATPADRDLAIATCQRCPALIPCGRRALTLSPGEVSGTIAGHWRRSPRDRDEPAPAAFVPVTTLIP